MKIIENLQGKEHRCSGKGNGGNGCNSLLAVVRSDLVYWPGVQSESWGQRDASVSFKCPVCEACTDLDKQHWPQNASSLRNVSVKWFKGQDNFADSGDK
jgi:hypothetical protein